MVSIRKTSPSIVSYRSLRGGLEGAVSAGQINAVWELDVTRKFQVKMLSEMEEIE